MIISELRTKAHLTQWQLANMIGLSASTVAQWEIGMLKISSKHVVPLAYTLIDANNIISLLQHTPSFEEQIKTTDNIISLFQAKKNEILSAQKNSKGYLTENQIQIIDECITILSSLQSEQLENLLIKLHNEGYASDEILDYIVAI